MNDPLFSKSPKRVQALWQEAKKAARDRKRKEWADVNLFGAPQAGMFNPSNGRVPQRTY